MSALYSHAIRWEWTTTNPITSVRQSAKRQKIPEILTVDELVKLLDAIPEPFRTAVFLAGASGLRVGELLGLKWEDVDFERNVIHIKRSIGREEDWANKAYRLAYVSPYVRHHLERQRREPESDSGIAASCNAQSHDGHIRSSDER